MVVTITCATGCNLLLECDTDNDGIISMDELFVAMDRTDLSEAEKTFISDAYSAMSINAKCPGCYTTTTTPARGVIVNPSYPHNATNGASIAIRAAVKNDGGETGLFKLCLYKGSSRVAQSSSHNVSAGCTGTTKTMNVTVPSTGTAVSYTIKCIRVI